MPGVPPQGAQLHAPTYPGAPGVKDLCMELDNIAKILVIVGVIIILIGGLVFLAGRVGLPLGQLPGDIRIQREGFSCFFPMVTMILLSVILTVVVNVIMRLIR
jgi:hypothetical protein